MQWQVFLPLNIFSALCVGLNHPRLWWRRGWPRLQRQSHAAQDQGWRFTATRTLWSLVLFHDVMTCHGNYMLRYMQWSIARSLKFGPIWCNWCVSHRWARAPRRQVTAHLLRARSSDAWQQRPSSFDSFFSKKTHDGWIREEVQTLRKSYVFNDISRIYSRIFIQSYQIYNINVISLSI